MRNAIRVACGLSGGVDSSVAAMLLKQEGYDVLGVFMRIWKAGADEELQGVCPSSGDFEDARIVAQKLNIPLVEVDFEKEYWNLVFSEFLKGYEEGSTPNPDILCNRHIKFGSFFRHCTERLGAEAVATGHYARTNFGYCLNSDLKNAKLLRAVDLRKDQTFFLSSISQTALKRTFFPLGHLKKSEVRKLAMENGLNKVAVKPDSMGICFIGKKKFPQFMNQFLEPKDGVFVDIDTGKIVGTHSGVHHWTLGQKCNFSGYTQKYYVAFRHPTSRTIYVAAGHNNPALYYSGAITEEMHWINEDEAETLLPRENGCLSCHFKYQQKEEPVPCILQHVEKSQMKVIFQNSSLRALTPGQHGVFYVGEECVGNAKIKYGLNDHSVIQQLYNGDIPHF